jgi:hypothetical protein
MSEAVIQKVRLADSARTGFEHAAADFLKEHGDEVLAGLNNPEGVTLRTRYRRQSRAADGKPT